MTGRIALAVAAAAKILTISKIRNGNTPMANVSIQVLPVNILSLATPNA